MANFQKLQEGLRSENIRWRTHNYEGTIIEMRNFDIQPMSLAELAAEQARQLKETKLNIARAKAAIPRPEHEAKLMPDEIRLLCEFAQCTDNSVNGDIHEAKGPDDLYTFVAEDTRRSVKPHLFTATLKSLIRKALVSIESTLSADYIVFTQAGFDAAKEALTHVDTPAAPQAVARAATVRAGAPRTAKGPTKKGTVLAMLQDHPTTKEEIAHVLAISTSAASSLVNDLRRDGHNVESSRSGGSTAYSVGKIPTVGEAAESVDRRGNDDSDDGDGTYTDRLHDTMTYYMNEGLSEQEAIDRAIEEEPKHVDPQG